MEEFEGQRKEMVDSLVRRGYIRSEEVKQAMLKVGRENFVANEYKKDAYIDTPLPIPGEVTISAPHS
jgi:protein-L-isoaspartate(D-aspartate) O-methyltransferase